LGLIINTKHLPAMNSPDPWEFFDSIYCISVDDRFDRREQVRKQFAGVGLLERVEFVLVARHPENREQGIFESHMLCLRKGLEVGARHILVFEDDVFFRDFDPEALAAACSHLNRLQSWEALFLGGIISNSRKTSVRSLARITYRCLSHAYALNAPMASRIVAEKWVGIPYDGLLRNYNGDFFGVYPMCAFQGLFASDNQTVLIDRVRRMFGGLAFIQKMNEVYQNHKVLIVVSHLIVVALAVFAVLTW
jgi:hypothetical protein